MCCVLYWIVWLGFFEVVMDVRERFILGLSGGYSVISIIVFVVFEEWERLGLWRRIGFMII